MIEAPPPTHNHTVYRNTRADKVSWLRPGPAGVWRERLAPAAANPGELVHVARNCDPSTAANLCSSRTRNENKLPGRWLLILSGTDLFAMLLEVTDSYVYDWKHLPNANRARQEQRHG